MKTRIIRILTLIICLSGCLLTTAQELPMMPSDPAVRCAVLPNGLSCYVAENSTRKGLADFALLAKDYSGNEVVLHYKDVFLSSETAVDSTLVSLMQAVSRQGTPADQAVVICGDVDASLLTAKVRYMSLMIDASTASAKPEYKWGGDNTISRTYTHDSSDALSTVRFEWRSSRTPDAFKGTIQSAIYDKTVWEVGEVACRMTRRELQKADIPVADVSWNRSGATEGYSDEVCSIAVTVASEHAEVASETVAAVLADIDKGNVLSTDIALAGNKYIRLLEKQAGNPVKSNSEYVRQCRNAFLYGLPVVSANNHLSFLRSKDLSESSRDKAFKDVASALINTISSGNMSGQASGFMLSDTLALPSVGVKQNIRSSKADPFSRGIMWTFANGFKVIYKKMPTDRVIYYSMSLNGGYGLVEDLEKGEGAFFSDYLDNCWISGMKGRNFKDLLSIAGMTMDMRVGLFNTAVSGKVADRNAGLMMKALLSVANESRVDTSEFAYYRKSESLRLIHKADSDVRVAVDNMICPDYVHTAFRSESGLCKDTAAKAGKFFSDMTSRMNDGVLVIVGDMDETDLKKLLQLYVGGFKVKKVAFRRPSIPYHPVSGFSTHSIQGDRDAVVLTLTAQIPMTTENHAAVEIAAMALERKLGVKLAYSRSLFPDERFSIMVEIDGKYGREKIHEVRDVISRLSDSGVSSEEMKVYKAYLKNIHSLNAGTPDYWLRVIPLRHLEGKDFTSGYAAKVDAVSAERVRSIFDALEKGAGAGLIIRK